jgi:hypothetical protein
MIYTDEQPGVNRIINARKPYEMGITFTLQNAAKGIWQQGPGSPLSRVLRRRQTARKGCFLHGSYDLAAEARALNRCESLQQRKGFSRVGEVLFARFEGRLAPFPKVNQV